MVNRTFSSHLLNHVQMCRWIPRPGEPKTLQTQLKSLPRPGEELNIELHPCFLGNMRDIQGLPLLFSHTYKSFP